MSFVPLHRGRSAAITDGPAPRARARAMLQAPWASTTTTSEGR